MKVRLSRKRQESTIGEMVEKEAEDEDPKD